MVGVLGKEGKEEVGREKCVWEGEGKGREEMGRAKGGRGRKVCVWEGGRDACSLGARPSKNWKGGSGKWGGVRLYTVECYEFYC